MDPIREAISAVLTADSELATLTTGIHHRKAPPGSQEPYCVFFKQAGTDAQALSGPALRNQLWAVKGVCRGGEAEAAEDIDQRLQELLDGAPLDVDGMEGLYLQRESDIEFGQDDAGEVIHHAGGSYRVIVDPA